MGSAQKQKCCNEIVVSIRRPPCFSRVLNEMFVKESAVDLPWLIAQQTITPCFNRFVPISLWQFCLVLDIIGAGIDLFTRTNILNMPESNNMMKRGTVQCIVQRSSAR
jgi:hypothetical protein